MSLVVFLRGVNVGGHKKFRPATLAKELGMVNIGAAGTFVAPGKFGPGALRREISQRLPFEAEIMVAPARDITGMLRRKPFGPGAPAKGVQWFVSVLGMSPSSAPHLPIEQPEGGKWEVRVIGVTGRYAFSLRRQGRVYPNEVVEKRLGVPATTRGWNTIAAIGDALEKA